MLPTYKYKPCPACNSPRKHNGRRVLFDCGASMLHETLGGSQLVATPLCNARAEALQVKQQFEASQVRVRELDQLGEWIGNSELDRIHKGQLRDKVAELEAIIETAKSLSHAASRLASQHNCGEWGCRDCDAVRTAVSAFQVACAKHNSS